MNNLEFPARVVVEHRGSYVVVDEDGERAATVAGKLRHSGELPVVGDWVALRDGVIHAVMPRRTAFVRGIAGGTTEAQVVAANVDVVFLVCALDDVSQNRIDRYLHAAASSGAQPVVVLTKSDLAPAIPVIANAPVHVVSNMTGEGLDALRPYFEGDATVALLGMSGAGKSTLANRLLGEELQATGAVDIDGRGKHTTTHRQLRPVPTGGFILDTPGMRELRLWDEDGAEEVFPEIAELAEQCRFRDCTHQGEPGCAVAEAAEQGTLPGDRLESYLKLERESASLHARKDARARSDQKRAIKSLSRSVRAHIKAKR